MSFRFLADVNVDKNDPQSPINNPDVQKLPFEPTMGSSYTAFTKHKLVRNTLNEAHRFPVELWQKHKNILFRSYFETPPSKDWDAKYNKFVDFMDELAASGKHPYEQTDLWLPELQKVLPLEYRKRVELGRSLPAYQRRQMTQLWSLLATHQMTSNARDQDFNLNLHTIGQNDLESMFHTPYPEIAQIEFSALPKTRREQWFDLALHYLKVAQIQPEAEAVKRCFAREHTVDQTLKIKPCFGPAVRYQMGYLYWVNKENIMGPCGHQVNALRDQMVDNPNFDQASATWTRLRQCTTKYNMNVAIAGTVMREKVETSFSKFLGGLDYKKSWLDQNYDKFTNKMFGRPDHHDEDDH